MNSHNPQQDSQHDTQQDTAENELFPPKSNHPTADVDRPTKQSTMTSSPDSVVRDPEVIYDDVPAENLQYPVPGTQCQFVALINHHTVHISGTYNRSLRHRSLVLNKTTHYTNLFICWYLCVDADDIYEDIQRPDQRGSNSWSSSEFESYDDLSDSETLPPACSNNSKVTHLTRNTLTTGVLRRDS